MKERSPGYESTRQELQVLAARLLATAQFQQMYPPRHPKVEESVEECLEELRWHLQRTSRIQIALAGNELVVGSIQVPVYGELLEEFARLLRNAGVERLVIREGVRRWELQTLLRLLVRGSPEIEGAGGIEAALEEASVRHISAGRVRLEVGRISDPESLFRAWEAYSTGLRLVSAVRRQVREDGTITRIDEIRDFAQDLVELALREKRPLVAIQTLKQHDEYSFTHSVNVAMLTVAMAASLPFDADDLHEIGVAALLHDVGKERIPREILNKPGKLDDEEWEVVNRHGKEGARMLSLAEEVGDLAPIVAYEHHLAYHEELREEAEWRPHLVSQLVCLADVYDALRSERPYREALRPDVAMEIMEEDVGRLFDPDLFSGFSGMVGVFPPGTFVRLDDGSLALVHAINPEALRKPRVLRLRDAAGTRLTRPEPLDLMRPGGPEIVDVVDAEEAGLEPLDYL